MRIKYDKSVDALYITLKKGKVLKTKEQSGYLVDYDKKGAILGLEILNYSKKVPIVSKATAGNKLAKQIVV
jgi:uncharacterized protein YuzE